MNELIGNLVLELYGIEGIRRAVIRRIKKIQSVEDLKLKSFSLFHVSFRCIVSEIKISEVAFSTN